jgi:hypothetical protein
MSRMIGIAVTALLVLVVGVAVFWLVQIGAIPVPGWITAREIASSDDLPWAAPGRKARYYAVKTWDLNRGPSGERRWGLGRFDLQTPVDTAFQAFAFLEKRRAMKAWAPAHEGDAGTFQTYSVYDELLPEDRHEKNGYGETIVTYTKRVAPHRFFVVSIQPTVVVMRSSPELVDWWQEHVAGDYASDSRWARWLKSLPEDQRLHTIWLENPIEVGTALPAGDEWAWFSPELDQPPVALVLTQGTALHLPIGQGALRFEPVPTGWRVLRE